MRKLLNNPWFVGAAAVLALAFVINAALPKRIAYGQGVAEVPDSSAASAPTSDGGDDAASIPAALKALPIPPTVRDPFATVTAVVVDRNAPAPEKAASADLVDSIHVSAVWIQKESNLALINGRIVAAGEEFGRLKFESASSDGVWFTHWKGRNFVAVGSDFSLSTPADQPLTTISSFQ